MKKISLIGAAFLMACSGEKTDNNTNSASHADDEMTKCVLGAAIKAGKNDCGVAGKYSCAGNNAADDSDAWIMMKKSICDKLMMGDVSAASSKLLDRLDMNKLDIEQMKEQMQNHMKDNMNDHIKDNNMMKDKMNCAAHGDPEQCS